MPQDEAAFAKFYARHVDTVYRMCYIRMKNQMDAEDVTQDVFFAGDAATAALVR